jgi:hypothetical protein
MAGALNPARMPLVKGWKMKLSIPYTNPLSAQASIRKQLRAARDALPETCAPSREQLKYISTLKNDLEDADRQVKALRAGTEK